MNKLSPRLLCQIYVLFVLLAATFLLALPYSLLALALLLVMLLITWRPLRPKLNAVITIMAIFLVPLVLQLPSDYLTYATGVSPRAAQIMTAISILPLIYLLDYHLRQNTPNMMEFLRGSPRGRRITIIAKTLFISVLTIIVVSFILDNLTLLFTGIIFALYLLAILIRVFLAIPRLPLNVSSLLKRTVAGMTVDVVVTASSKASVKLQGLLNPVDPWVKVTPNKFALYRNRLEINLDITPPLAGPSHPQLQVSCMDPWGFIQVNQQLEPVELHVIPRAKYAEWLAMKYLEQTGAVATVTATPPLKSMVLPKRGIEYFDSRNYQPGDQLKNIDWKHTRKLNKLIVKEFTEIAGKAVVVGVNLSVLNAEEADELAFDLITAVLTLAQENVPTALAAYDHQRVVLATTTVDPEEALKQALSLVKDITAVEFTHRFLQMPNISQLRRDIVQLKQTTSEPAQRLLNILNFEFRAMEKAAKNHPATLALSSATDHTASPLTVILISRWNHDAEALLITTEKLKRRGFITTPIRMVKAKSWSSFSIDTSPFTTSTTQ
ncbi:MAG: DUF58 domain-containing protein [Dehalococcoidales bacterium]